MCLDLTFGIGELIGVLFPAEDYFSCSQHSLIVCSSLSGIEASFVQIMFKQLCL